MEDEPLEDRLARVRSRREQMKLMNNSGTFRTSSQEAAARTYNVLSSLSVSPAAEIDIGGASPETPLSVASGHHQRQSSVAAASTNLSQTHTLGTVKPLHRSVAASSSAPATGRGGSLSSSLSTTAAAQPSLPSAPLRRSSSSPRSSSMEVGGVAYTTVPSVAPAIALGGRPTTSLLGGAVPSLGGRSTAVAGAQSPPPVLPRGESYPEITRMISQGSLSTTYSGGNGGRTLSPSHQQQSMTNYVVSPPPPTGDRLLGQSSRTPATRLSAGAPPPVSPPGSSQRRMDNTSFTSQGGSGIGSGVAASSLDLISKLEKEHQRVKGLKFENWEAAARKEAEELEYNARLQLLQHSLHHNSLKVSRMAEELAKAISQVDTIQEAYRDPNKRILSLLGHSSSSTSSKRTAPAPEQRGAADAHSILYRSDWDLVIPEGRDAEGRTADPGQVSPAPVKTLNSMESTNLLLATPPPPTPQQQHRSVLAEEKELDKELDPGLACMMLDTYARHRDQQNDRLEKTVVAMQERIVKLESLLEESRLERDEVALKRDRDYDKFLTEMEHRTEQLAELKRSYAECQTQNLELLQGIRSYETEIHTLREEVAQTRVKSRAVWEECKEAEVSTLRQYQEKHAEDREAWSISLQQVRSRKDHYKHKCHSMEEVQAECLKGRAMIQAEIMELQESRRMAEGSTRHLIGQLKTVHAKEMTEAHRDQESLHRLKALVKQQSKELRMAEELNLAHSVNPIGTSMLVDAPPHGSSHHSSTVGGTASSRSLSYAPFEPR